MHKLVSRSNNLKEPYPAPCMTMHFPFICFTSLAAARIASCLTVSNLFFCVTAQPPSFTITSTSHLSAITTDEKAKCEICQACFFHPDSLVSLVPSVFFGHFSRDHPTRSRNMNQWRNNEVFITPFLLILKKIRYSIWLFHQKGHYFMNSKFPLHLFHHPGNHATLLPKRILLPLGLTGILEYHYPLPIPTARCPGSRTKSSQK